MILVPVTVQGIYAKGSWWNPGLSLAQNTKLVTHAEFILPDAYGRYDPYGVTLGAHVAPGTDLQGVERGQAPWYRFWRAGGVLLRPWDYEPVSRRWRFHKDLPEAVLRAALAPEIVGRAYGGLGDYAEGGELEDDWLLGPRERITCSQYVAYCLYCGALAAQDWRYYPWGPLTSWQTIRPIDFFHVWAWWDRIVECDPADPAKVIREWRTP